MVRAQDWKSWTLLWLAFFLFKVHVLKENKRVPLARTGILYLLLWTRLKVQQTWSHVRRPPAKWRHKVALTQSTKIKRNCHFQKVQHSLPLRKRLVALKTSFYWGRVKWTAWSHRRMAYALHQVRENYYNQIYKVEYNLWPKINLWVTQLSLFTNPFLSLFMWPW